MAYGKGKTGKLDKRTADIARFATSDALHLLRRAYLDALPLYVEAIWPDTVLTPLPRGKALDRVMLDVQASLKGRLNSVWAEKARIAVTAMVTEQVKRARGNLLGRFKHLSTAGDALVKHADGRTARRLVNFPEAWSFALTEADIAALQAKADALDAAGVFALFHAVKAGTSDLPEVQADALAAMLDQVEARFGRPEWDGDEGVVQLHLDWRCVEGTKAAWPRILASLGDAVDSAVRDGRTSSLSFAIASHTARGGHLPLVVTVRPEVLLRLAGPVQGRAGVTSVAVEIGPRETAVRAVIAAQPAEMVPLSEVTHLVGRDFGFANTCAYSVVRVAPGALTQARIDLADRMLSTRDKAKAMARDYLASHGSDTPVVERLRIPGRRFLDRVADHASRIDGLRSEIDLVYGRIGRVKHRINAILGVHHDAQVDLEAWHEDRLLDRLVLRMGRQLDLVGRLKAIRRGVYAAIDGLKRSWFGWVSGREVELVGKYGPGAALVREGLDFVAIEIDNPRYKGRTFNKMLNGGARGRYAACASDKLKWHGHRELVVPSFHTSTTDHRFGIVDPAQRKGETFRSAKDGAKSHADEHASHTIALWLVLDPLPLRKAA